MTRSMLLVLVGVVTAGVVACGGKKPATTPTPQPNADSSAAAEKARQDSMARADADRRAREEAERVARQRMADSLAALGHSSEAVRTLLSAMIHFDYDKSNIRGEDAAVLDQKVSILHANSGATIRVSGHCDERGSDEYNLALGNRRATAAKQYLVSHGIDAGRIETTSYGKERPLDPAHTEQAWSTNRRDEFEVLSGGDALRQP
jgi:peptidoglycan-associated lipoprotein